MSTPQDRLDQTYIAYSDAYANRPRDLKEAMSTADVKAILANVERLEILYLRAARQALDATGDDVEAAYEAAVDANRKTREAYQDARDLAERIRLVGELVGVIGNLLEKAS